MMAIEIDGSALTMANVLAVATAKPGETVVSLTTDAERAVNRAAAAVQTLIARREIAYGITTGFGAFKDKIIAPEEVETLQRNIIFSHAVGVGEPFDRETVRAIMLIRANTLARGHSGIRLQTLQLLLDMLNRGVHPRIPQIGSLGASGDLAPLAHLALVLLGEGEAEYNGEMLPGGEALRRADLQPARLAAKEGLALTNGTAVMCALGVLIAHHGQRLINTADIAGSLSLEALHGTTLAFDERIQAVRPHPRQMKTAAHLRQILQASEFTRHFDPKNVQDAYTLRCMPQVHGAVRDAVDYAEWVINIELNSVTDNPLLFIDDDNEEISVLSGGNFHGEIIAIAMDYLTLAMTELGNISERRLTRLTDEASNAFTLPAFLIKHGGLNSGFMLTQYTAAALASENKVLAHPASADTIPTSANVEDHVSMGVTAARHARLVLKNVETILAIELMAAAQGIDFRREQLGADARLGVGTQPVFELIRQAVPFIENDAIMYPYIERVRQLIADGSILQASEAAIAKDSR